MKSENSHKIPLKDKQFILFDLDGTLIDSHEGIYNCIRYALRKMNRIVPEEKILRKFIGPVLEDSFQKILHFSEEDAYTAASIYRERYSEKGWRECELYGLVKEMLEELYDEGKTIALATSKPALFSEKILREKGIYDYFSCISGSSVNGLNGNKTDMIRNALINLNVINSGSGTEEENHMKDLAVMTGDRKMDIIGAHENGIEAIGAGYGFIQDGEFEEYNADYVANSVDELEELLL